MIPIKLKLLIKLNLKKKIFKSNTLRGKPKIPKLCIGKNKRLDEIKKLIKDNLPIKSLKINGLKNK